MFSFSLAFLAGILLLQFFTSLPSFYWCLLAPGLAIVFCVFQNTFKRLILSFALGFAWCLYFAHAIAQFSLPPAWEGKNIWIRGTIVSLPRVSAFQTSFIFQVNSIQTEKVSTCILLSWRDQKAIPRVGDEWLLPVRLKRIHSTLNPGGQDYEAWAFQNGLRAKGYITEKQTAKLIKVHRFIHPIDRLRQILEERVERYLSPSQTSPWITALIVGERKGIPPSAWTVLRNTGTNHLMAIAGLHIGFLAALAQGITKLIVRFWPRWMLRLPMQQAAAAAALGMALFYSALAGFSIPTQRALIMLSVLLITVLCKRLLPLWQGWSLALLLVLIINPLSVLSSSFWLSFTTLALIIYGVSGRLGGKSWWWKWGRPQWVITIGLLPLSLWLFTQYSFVSFMANAIAIPWMGFLILPFCFLSVLLLLIHPAWAGFTLSLADKSLSWLWNILSCLSQFNSVIWQQALPDYIYLIAATIGILILLLPSGFPARMLGLVWLLPLVFFKAPEIARNEFKFTLLDVGQGLASVIQTQNHTLIFDAGAHMGAMDMGEAVVLPYLASQGIKQIDMMVISHGDNDHSGGAMAILKQIPVKSIKTSVPQIFPAWPASYCLAGQTWRWDGVQFKFLHPVPGQLNLDNNSSCVLQIAAENKRVLLTGDIEALAENVLIATKGNDLAADILVVPHHGSKTSGLPSFIGRVHPQYALYALGYRNRYHFPYPGVVKTYRDWGVVQYDSVSSGAMQFKVGKNRLEPKLYRRYHGRYWSDSGSSLFSS